MRAALKVLSAHVDRRRADPKHIELLRNTVVGCAAMADVELARSVVEGFIRSKSAAEHRKA